MLWFNKKEKLALDTVVRAAGKPATALVVETALPPEHVFPATATHFGGNPCFEAGDVWPISAEHQTPYDFVCQVNLNDCPERPGMPFDLFTVFLCWAMVEARKGGELQRACVVRTYDGASPDKAVAITRPPPHDEEDYQVRPCVVRTETFMTYPSLPLQRPIPRRRRSLGWFPAVATAASKFKNPDAAYEASLKRLGVLHDFRSRVGGFPNWVHEDTFEDEDVVFLAQIDYEPDANNCIGDAAPIYIGVCADNPTRIETDFYQSF